MSNVLCYVLLDSTEWDNNFDTVTGNDRGGSRSRSHPTSRSSNDPPKRQESSESECNDNSSSGDNLTEGGVIILFEQLRSCHTSF